MLKIETFTQGFKKMQLSFEFEPNLEYQGMIYDSLKEKINECNLDFEKHLEIQKNWRKNELNLRQEMIDELKEIIYS